MNIESIIPSGNGGINGEGRTLKEICEKSHLSVNELSWIVTSHKMDFIPTYYWEWLYSFRFEYDKIKVYLDEETIYKTLYVGYGLFEVYIDNIADGASFHYFFLIDLIIFVFP